MSNYCYVVSNTEGWAPEARSLLGPIRRGAVVQVFEDGQVLGYLVPARVFLCAEVVDPPEVPEPTSAEAVAQGPRKIAWWFGLRRYDPSRDLFVPALPDRIETDRGMRR